MNFSFCSISILKYYYYHHIKYSSFILYNESLEIINFTAVTTLGGGR